MRDGSLLRINEAGARPWIFQCQIDDRRRKVGLGSYPNIGLAEVCQRAAAEGGAHRLT